VCMKVLVEPEEVIHDLDAVRSTLPSYVTSETEGIANGCIAHGSSALLEPALWHNENGEVPLLRTLHLPVVMQDTYGGEELGRRCDTADGEDNIGEGCAGQDT
ncbi:hypothetical protein SK128_011327, partial [Halocaridina rubra]